MCCIVLRGGDGEIFSAVQRLLIVDFSLERDGQISCAVVVVLNATVCSNVTSQWIGLEIFPCLHVALCSAV